MLLFFVGVNSSFAFLILHWYTSEAVINVDSFSMVIPDWVTILVYLNNFEKMGHQGAVQNEDLPNYVHNRV